MRLVEKIKVYFRSSLSRKFMLSIILVNAVLVGAIGWELYSRDRITRDFRQVRRAEAMARVLAAAGTPAIKGGAQPDLQRVAEAAVKANWVALVAFHDSTGRIIAIASAPGPGQHRAVMPVTKIQVDGTLHLSRTEDLIVATRADSGGPQSGWYRRSRNRPVGGRSI